MKSLRRLLKPILKPSSKASQWLLFVSFTLTIYLAEAGYLVTIVDYLSSENLTFAFGKKNITIYLIIKSLIAVITLFWIASIVSDFGEKSIKKLMGGHRESNKVLIVKFFQGILYFSITLVVLDVVGVDVTNFAVFSGALGIGIGFGLQKVSSNFISGLILLFEKSVEVGDLIELSDGVAGFVRSTGARYTLIETFENREIMVPNEDFITNRVTNWTFSNERGRIDVSVGVSYDSDLDQVKRLILEAALEHPRCSKVVLPECYLVNFGDSSVNFDLYFWVEDIISGRKGPRSDVLFSIWRKFRDNNISIPFPQRDINIKNN